MAKITFNDLKQMSKDELISKLNEFRKELMKLNAQVATGTTPKSPGHLKNIKKNISRINTLLKIKEDEKKHG